MSVASSVVNTQQSKKEWIHRWVQKLLQAVQTDENKKTIQVFLLDPILNYVLDRLFPYVLILCVLFVILTLMISATLVLVFMRLPAAFASTTAAASIG